MVVSSLKKSIIFPLEFISGETITARPWKEADLLFHSDPQWLGADDAYSEDLGNGRVLWLFGDSFVAENEPFSRKNATMVRNSIAIQTGYDPSTASMDFFWNKTGNHPSSFFPEDNDTWHWPGDAVTIENKLIIFLMTIKSSSGPLGFKLTGWRAVSIDNFDQTPSVWNLKWLDTPANHFNLVVSGSIFRSGNYICGYSYDDDDSTGKLVRWPITQALKDDLTQPQWWCGNDEGWVLQSDLKHEPSILYSDDTTEFTVDYLPESEHYLEIQTLGFGPADLAFRLSDSMTGPWTSPRIFYEPPEKNIPEIMIYAGKAHPELTGADLVLTYATNSFDYDKMIENEKIYFPRFLKADFSQQNSKSVETEAA